MGHDQPIFKGPDSRIPGLLEGGATGLRQPGERPERERRRGCA